MRSSAPPARRGPPRRPERASLRPIVGRSGRRVRDSTRLDERQLKPVRIGDHEQALAPRHVHRLLVERAPACFDLGGEPVEVLRGRAAQPRADSLLAVPTLGKIVLGEIERDRPGARFGFGRSLGKRAFLGRLFGRHQLCSVRVTKRSEPPRVSPDSPFPSNHRSSRSWRPATLSRFGKASSETAKAASRRRAARSVARSASARASKARKGRTPRSCSPPRTPAALAWRSRPVSRKRAIPRRASKRARPSHWKRWMGRPRSRVARWRCGEKLTASTTRRSGRRPKRRRRTVPCRKRFRATSTLRWMQSCPDALAAGCVPWTVYLLRCRDGSLYTGITNDLPQRLESHRRGKASAYTRARRPVSLAYHKVAADRGSALKREAAIRRLSRVEKLALCSAGT